MMIPVFQATKYDCLSAAVASVLELPLSDVPVWWELTGDAWMKAVVDWARSRGFGICYFDFKDRREWPILANHWLIVAGSTPRSSEYLHCVVARAEWDGKETRLVWVHDPLPGGSYIEEPDHCLIFVPG